MPASRHFCAIAGHRVGGHRDDRQVACRRRRRVRARASAGSRCSRPSPASGNPSAPGRSVALDMRSSARLAVDGGVASTPSSSSRRCADHQVDRVVLDQQHARCARGSGRLAVASASRGSSLRATRAPAAEHRRCSAARSRVRRRGGCSRVRARREFLRHGLRRRQAAAGARGRRSRGARGCGAARARCCASPLEVGQRPSDVRPGRALRRAGAQAVERFLRGLAPPSRDAPVRQQHAQAHAQARIGAEQQQARMPSSSARAPACRRAPSAAAC